MVLDVVMGRSIANAQPAARLNRRKQGLQLRRSLSSARHLDAHGVEQAIGARNMLTRQCRAQAFGKCSPRLAERRIGHAPECVKRQQQQKRLRGIQRQRRGRVAIRQPVATSGTVARLDRHTHRIQRLHIAQYRTPRNFKAPRNLAGGMRPILQHQQRRREAFELGSSGFLTPA